MSASPVTAATAQRPAITARYGAMAMGLHWLLALAIVVSFGVGVFMVELSTSPTKLKLYSWHKWAGVTILALSAVRLLWRLVRRPPPLEPAQLAAMPSWQQRAHRAVHALFYVLFFAVPLAGWAHSSSAGFPVVWFGVLPLPDFVPVDKALAETLKGVHKLLALSLGALVLLHVAAALKHQLVDGDGLLLRMWPARPG